MARCVSLRVSARARALLRGVLERPPPLLPIFDREFGAGAGCAVSLALDVVPEPSIDFVLVPAHAPLKPHQLVFQAET